MLFNKYLFLLLVLIMPIWAYKIPKKSIVGLLNSSNVEIHFYRNGFFCEHNLKIQRIPDSHIDPYLCSIKSTFTQELLDEFLDIGFLYVHRSVSGEVYIDYMIK